MVDNNVLLSDRSEAIPTEVADALGKASVIGGKNEVGALVDDQLLGVIETENSVAGEDVCGGGIEPFHQETTQIGRHRGIDREMDHMTTPASFERRFVEADQILGLFLDFDLAVAQHTKDALRHHREPRKQVVEKQRDHLLDRQKTDPFARQAHSQAEANFADLRNYMYQGKKIDQQVHLGYDLAVTQHVGVEASNDGRVVYAAPLGIYGNCIVVDHGYGLQTIYGHLSHIDVHEGDMVKRGQVMGQSGMTGMAGGDHIHFAMQLDGVQIDPKEWWDPHWIQDHIAKRVDLPGFTK